MAASKHLLTVATVSWVVLAPFRSLAEKGREFGEDNLAEAYEAEGDTPLFATHQPTGADEHTEASKVEGISPLVQSVWKSIELDRLATATALLLEQSPALVNNEHWCQLLNLQGRIRSTENEKERIAYSDYEIARNKQRDCLTYLCMEIFSSAKLTFR